MTTELPANATKLTPDQAASAIANAYKSVVGKAPSFPVLSLLVGQSALETGNWEKMFDYNFGNTMPMTGDKYVEMLNASEVINGVSTPMREKFAAYTNAVDGAKAWIVHLIGHNNWWTGLQTGTLEGYIKGLTTTPKYFTANSTSYTNGVASRMASYSSSAKKYAGHSFSDVLQVIIGLVVGSAVVIGAMEVKGRYGR